MSTTTLTREQVVERAARAILKFDQWQRRPKKRKAPSERQKGEVIQRPAFKVADQIVSAFTDDQKEQCLILHEAHERAKELREC